MFLKVNLVNKVCFQHCRNRFQLEQVTIILLRRQHSRSPCRTSHYTRHYISFTIHSQSCRSISFWLAHVQTKLSYRDTPYNRRNATRTINLPQQCERHADFPPSSFTQPFRILSRAKRSCDHSTREYSFVDTR